MATTIYSCTECGKLADECTKLEPVCNRCYDRIESENEFYNPNY